MYELIKILTKINDNLYRIANAMDRRCWKPCGNCGYTPIVKNFTNSEYIPIVKKITYR